MVIPGVGTVDTGGLDSQTLVVVTPPLLEQVTDIIRGPLNEFGR